VVPTPPRARVPDRAPRLPARARARCRRAPERPARNGDRSRSAAPCEARTGRTSACTDATGTGTGRTTPDRGRADPVDSRGSGLPHCWGVPDDQGDRPRPSSINSYRRPPGTFETDESEERAQGNGPGSGEGSHAKLKHGLTSTIGNAAFGERPPIIHPPRGGASARETKGNYRQLRTGPGSLQKSRTACHES
jgi:hypothetical protein